MQKDILEFLNLRQQPFRLNAVETAGRLGFSVEDIRILINANLLKPLGNPAQNGTKYFARVAIERHGEDVDWLNRATAAVNRHWLKHNEKRKTLPVVAS